MHETDSFSSTASFLLHHSLQCIIALHELL